MKKLIGLTLVLFAFPAFAADVSYNYLQVGYQQIDLDDDFVDVDGNGFNISGSFELNENWFIGAGYSATDFDFGIDLDQLGVGVGYHVPLSDNVDFYGMLSALRLEASASGLGSEDESGYGAKIGVRGMLSDAVELTGHIAYSDLGDGLDGTSFGAGVLYNFTDSVAAGLFIDTEEDATTLGAGVRFYW